MGFHLFARGNNHACDWGIEGLRATARVLDGLKLPHSGCGEHRRRRAGRSISTPWSAGSPC